MGLYPETGSLEMLGFSALAVAATPSKHKLKASAPINEGDIFTGSYTLPDKPTLSPLKPPLQCSQCRNSAAVHTSSSTRPSESRD